MKQINYIMVVKQVDEDRSWEEPMAEMVEDGVTAEERANQIINYFNRTLRPGEKARELVSVRDTEQTEKATLNHVWKKASLVTERGGYDRYRCEVCGATGKRHGLSEGITIDPKFKKRINCPGKKK